MKFLFNSRLILLAITLVAVVVAAALCGSKIRFEGFEDVKGTTPKMVLYYANWCPHCEKMLPDWDRMKSQANEKGLNVEVEKHDCAVEEELAEEKGINAFPEIRLEKGEEFETYEGPRTTEGLMDFLNEKL